MAEHARTEYADIHFDICYCSPLIRAKETAEIVLKGRNIPIITDDRLKEMSFGIYEGTANCIDTPGCPMKDLLIRQTIKFQRMVEKALNSYLREQENF